MSVLECTSASSAFKEFCVDCNKPVINNALSSHARRAAFHCIDVGYLAEVPGLRVFWLQIQTPEMFISASDLTQNDCSNAVWRWSNSSGQNRAFDQPIFLFVFYIRTSCKYVNSDVNLLVSQGSYTPLCKPIT